MSENRVQSYSAVRAPYNFVPFSDQVLLRYESPDQLPHHNKLDPALKNGAIHVTLTAETPVYISNGGGRQGKDGSFFRNAAGNPAIPGSTLRGMTRENMTVLGFGLTRPGENFRDQQMFFRELSAEEKTVKSRAVHDYHEIMETRTYEEGAYSIPERVRAGYLYREKDGYYIHPVRGTYLRVSPQHPDLWDLDGKYAQAFPVAYKCRGDKVTNIIRSKKYFPDMQSGMLLLTGKAPDGPNSRYIFPGEDREAEPIKIPVEDSIAYAEDWKNRKNILRGSRYDPNFWALPRMRESKPVFFLEWEGHIYFGMSLFLRVKGHRLAEGLPELQRKLGEEAAKEERCVLDYPCAVLGFAGKKRSYRSRVSFEDCVMVKREMREPPVTAILAEPKPVYFPSYTEEGKHYGMDDFRLRGSKHYWMKSPEEPYVPRNRERVASRLYPQAAGTQFSGVIRYRNLTEDELGLLLWCLRLEEGCRQTLGMGKPYGYGRMRLTIDKLEEYQLDQLYSFAGLNRVPASSGGTEERVDRYIRAYKEYLRNWASADAADMDESIRAFLYMHRTVMENDAANYMNLGEYESRSEVLPTVRDLMEEEERCRQAEEASRPQTEEELYAALLAKWGRKH